MDFEFDFESIPENAYCFLFCDDELLIEEIDGVYKIPLIYDLKMLNMKPTYLYYMGLLDENKCYAANISTENIPKQLSFKKIRRIYGHVEDLCYWLMLRAFHIMSWIKANRFCGCCGGLTKALDNEHAVKCVECEHIFYPRISPAIMVAVIKDDKILLARSNRFATGWYSVIAGFVEPGEALEDCAKRELKEEVGIEVTNIQYFGSQPWPFPDSLMIAFTARWSKGIITIDNEEITDANWYSANNLPKIPGKVSIARQLIDWFVEHAKF